MKLKSVTLKDFKRFDNLTIDLGNPPSKIIALVGPNGCGKSSVFDAFEEVSTYAKRSAKTKEHESFFLKSQYSETEYTPGLRYDFNRSISLIKENGSGALADFDKKSFYIRSAYRFTPKLQVNAIQKQPDIIDDEKRPASSIALDTRMTQNYERLTGRLISAFYKGDITGEEHRKNSMGKINNILEKVLDVKLSDLGNITAGKGQLFFEKGKSKNFPYDNLSSGEKEVIDIVIDLIIKTEEFDDTVYSIDEPELHLNTAIQRRLLIEIEKIIPDNCQLWIATHSIGFLRALQEELKDKTSVLDFSEKDYFNGAQTIKPMPLTRKNWQRVFETALADLTGLLAPKKIIYCEGGLQYGLDEAMFNAIFEQQYPDTMFVSSGSKDAVQKYSAIALNVINKAFSGVKITAIVDRDNDLERLNNGTVVIRKLQRREFENYLFDKEVLRAYCDNEGNGFDEARYDEIVKDINNDDVKKMINDIKSICHYSGNDINFKLGLAKVISKTEIYAALERDIGLSDTD